LEHSLVCLLHATVCRALLNRHRLPALLHVARALRPEAFPKDEWQMFTGRGAAAVAAAAAGGARGNGAAARPASGRARPAWVREDCGAAFDALVAALPGLERDADLQNASAWAAWAGGGGGDEVPARAASRLTGSQGLLIIKALKPEALPAALSRWAGESCVRHPTPPTPLSNTRTKRGPSCTQHQASSSLAHSWSKL
jgi:hypothetical protein